MDPRTLGPPTSTNRAAIVVAVGDSELLDQLLSITAVVGVEPLVLGDAGLMRQHWASASMVLLGIDQAARIATMGVARRTEVYLVTGEGTSDQAQHWSMQVGAAVVTLPGSASWLSDALANLGQGRGTGRLVCVMGGSGGVGASTLAAGLAFAAARTHRTMLIDADPISGGLDLLLGAERTPGWRWPRLATARGHLGDLTGQLPAVDGIDLLSMARGESSPGWAPHAEQMNAVLRSARRSHTMTVVDIPRALGGVAWDVMRRADLAVLVVRDDVRGIAAAREKLRELEAECEHLGLVVRQGRSRLLEPKLVASGIGLPLLGSFPEDPTLVVAADRGDPPGRSGRSSLSRLCHQLLQDVPIAEPSEAKALMKA